MAVVAHIRDDDVVARLRMIGQISRQIVIRHNVGDTFRRLRVQPVIYIVKIHLREVFNVKKGKIEWADIEYRAAKIGLRINLPGNPGILEQPHQVPLREELRLSRLSVFEYAE